MKKHTFLVTITVADEIPDDKAGEVVKEMAGRIADALRHECDSGNGLTPEETETYTEEIKVVPHLVPEGEVNLVYDIKRGFIQK